MSYAHFYFVLLIFILISKVLGLAINMLRVMT